LLELLNLKGCLVTIDAMGYQKQIVDGIQNAGADYLLAVGLSHEPLQGGQIVEPQLFDSSSESPYFGVYAY